MNDQNSKRLFYGSCFALITTAFSFSIRAGILPQLGETFNLTAQQLGFINSMFFYGFPISMLLGGIFYSAIGPKKYYDLRFCSPYSWYCDDGLRGRLYGSVDLYFIHWNWLTDVRKRLVIR